ncbi:MAG: 1-deoxy-D-xylulose-5-phosphate reductoisomerase [Planctomycetota bacterium]
MKRRIAVLGSTGSVGAQALSLIAERRDLFDVVFLSAHRSHQSLSEQVRKFAPKRVCLSSAASPGSGDSPPREWLRGADGIRAGLSATAPDLVLNAITGAAGLPASEWALREGIDLALANKESLVIAGDLLTGLARASGANILPVDSEHCAIAQCLRGNQLERVRSVHLTGSGGPFRDRPLGEFAGITPAEALRHPTWEMGPRITIGSATMMNKAFEILEAHWLFGLSADRIRVLIHPQSVIHSMVEFVDGSVMAQLGVPDMRVPILYCLGYPDRLAFPTFEPLDLRRIANLSFLAVDPARYPAVPLAYQVLARGGDAGARFNAADEVATAAFLAGRIPFQAITTIVERVVLEAPSRPIESLTDALLADSQAREQTTRLLPDFATVAGGPNA